VSHGIYCITEEECVKSLFNRVGGHIRCVSMAILQIGGFYRSANFGHLWFSGAFA
jgi:hypothetical protein